MRKPGQRTSLNLATRLQLVLALVAAIVVLVAGLGYARLVTFEHRVIALYEDRVLPLRDLKAVSDLQAIQVVDTVHKVCARRRTPAQGREILTRAIAGIDAAWMRYASSPTLPQDTRLLGETGPLLARARRAIDTAQALMTNGDLAGLEAFRTGDMYTAIDPLTERLGQLVDVQVHESDVAARVAQQELRTARQVTTIVLVLAGLLAMGMGVLFAHRLASSLRAIEPVVRAAAGGDLSRRISLSGSDELAQMAGDVDRMISSLEASQREVAAHATALETSEREARAANAAKSIFLSSMSHELRTPLNVILGYTQLMLGERTRPRSELQELTRIMDAGNHLLGLIDDVLSISRIEAGTVELRPRAFSPAALLRTINDMLAPRALAKGLELDVAASPAVPDDLEADDRKLTQVLVNLIGNAIKFTSRGRVCVRGDFADDRLFLVVTDTGPGISAEEQAQLFHTFYQGAQGRDVGEGTGLGLYISQALVHLMGGELRVLSHPGEGAEFSFSVRARATQAPIADARDYATARMPAGHEIGPMLVVDDRLTNRDVLARLLQRLGVTTLEAATGQEALARCSETDFSVVWMDLRMPGIGGLETLVRLRAREAERGRRGPLVIAITASVIEFDRGAAIAAGFDGLVTKPFLDETVCRAIESVLGLTLETEPAVPRAAPARAAVLAGAVPTGLRQRLLAQLARGDLDEGLRCADEVPDAATRVGLRALIESYDVDELISALRAFP